jgi:NAD(P)-dependent dehydrogenase (short-subunit alcohol dehydrogenase family)
MTEPNFSLAERVVVLTGGAGILGTRMTQAVADHGALVAVVDRDPARLSVVEGTLGRQSRRVRTFQADITDREALLDLRREVERTFGTADVLVNNAAFKSANFFEPFETFPLEDWDSVMRVNLTSAMLACQIFGGPMAERGRGSIINTLSVYGIVAPDQRIYEGSMYEGRAINTPAIYSASKAGLWGLTKYLASYWGGKGVRVNAITPGGVFSGQNDTFVQKYSARIPLGRMAQQDEMGGALVFLASDASSYVTGQNLVVDGGLTVW